jgi:hypothetical protein
MGKDRQGRKENEADRRRAALRDRLWPGSGRWIWDFTDREKVVGFATIPRLMPLILHLIKHLSGDGGTGDPSPVYLELWCRDFGQGLISISDEMECAYASGYSSSRALRTWRGHMLRLAELGFILHRQEGLREFGQVLLLNPLAVCVRLHEEGRVPDAWWTAFVGRAAEIPAPLPPALDLTAGQAE